MSSELVHLVLARGLAAAGVQSFTLDDIALDGAKQARIKPPDGFTHAIIYQVQPAVPPPEEYGQPIFVYGERAFTSVLDEPADFFATWTVSDGRYGRLEEISVTTTDFTDTEWQIQIAGVNQLAAAGTDTLAQPLTLPFGGKNIIQAGQTVRVGLGSVSGSPSSTAYASITGNEYPYHVFTMRLSLGRYVAPNTFNVDRDLVNHGLLTWAETSEREQLQVDVSNVNGITAQTFQGACHLLATTAENLEAIRQLARAFGVPQEPVPAPIERPPGFRSYAQPFR